MLSSRRALSVAATVLILGAASSAQMPEIGKPSPAFVCKSHLGKETAFPPKGQWAVLAFYPKASTPG